MTEHLTSHRLSRRNLQRLLITAPAPLAAFVLAGHFSGIAFAQSDGTVGTPISDRILAPTPACGDHADFAETLAQTAGPFFTPDSPERTDLIDDGAQGVPLLLTGYVYSPECQPVEAALLDFWQANDAGNYDNDGYDFRGHQFSDENGRFELHTIVPGLYPGRTRHIHVRVQAPNGPVLTTQLYFPNEPANAHDGIFDERLLIDAQQHDNGELGFFTFVVQDRAE